MRGVPSSPHVHQPFPWGTCATSSAQVSGRCKSGCSGGSSAALRRGGARSRLLWDRRLGLPCPRGRQRGHRASLLLYSQIEIKTLLRGESGLASRANESTAGMKA